MKRCLPATDIIEFEKSPERVKQIIESAGTQMAGLHYTTWHGIVVKVSYMAKKDYSISCLPSSNMIRLYNVNKFQKDVHGNRVGRGCWDLICLDDVIQVTVKGKRFKIQR